MKNSVGLHGMDWSSLPLPRDRDMGIQTSGRCSEVVLRVLDINDSVI
jgi:hypothetical protein